MKKLLRITTACLAVLLSALFFSARAGSTTTVVATSENGSTSDYPFPLSWNMGASQSIYPASVLSQAISADSYTITQLVYPLKAVPTSGKVNVSVYMAQSDANYLAAPLAESAFTCVTANYEVDCAAITDGKLRIPVATPFEMQKGKSLVIGYYVTADEDTAPKPSFEFEECQFDGVYDDLSWYNYSKPTNVAMENAMFSNEHGYKVPGLSIVYEVAGQETPEPDPAGGEAVIATSENGSTSDYPFPLSWNMGASQSLYPASVLSQAISADSYTITQLVYPLKAVPTSGKVNVSVYMAQSDANYLAAPLAESAFTCVTANYEVDCAAITDSKLLIPVATPFEMQKGKSLVIGMYVTADEDTAPKPSFEFEECQFDGVYDDLSWYNYSKPTNVAMENAMFSNEHGYKVPGLAIAYEVAQTPAPAGGEAVIATSEYGSTSDYPFPLSWNMGASQSLYPASVLSQAISADSYTITQLVYPLKSVPTSGKVNVSVYMTQSDASYLAAPLAESAFTCVTANYEVDCSAITDGKLRIPVATPFEMQKGKSLVIGYYVTADESSAPNPAFSFESCQIDGVYDPLTWHNYSKPSNVGMEGAMWGSDNEYKVPGLSIAYEVAQGPAPAGGEAVIATSEYGSTSDYPFPLSWNKGASQSLYPASAMSAAVSADSYTISQLVYPLKSVPTSGKVNVSVYMTQSDADYLAAPLAESAFTCVTSNYEIDCAAITDSKLLIPVATPFEMQKGKSLVVGMYVTADENSAPDPAFAFEECSFDGVYSTLTWYNYSKPTNVALEGAMFGNSEEYKVPGLSIVYETKGGSEPVKVTDLAVASVTAPEGEMYAGQAYEFSVMVENTGDFIVEEYTVQLFNAADDAVLGTVESTKPVYTGMSNRETFEVTFDEPGTYSIAARVIAVDDAVADNDACEPIEVVVEKLPYKAVVLTVTPEAPALGETAEFAVEVANEGAVALEGYTVNLYLVREGFGDKLVATAAEVPAIEVGATANVTFPYTFELGGAYAFKAEVVKGAGVPSYTPVLNLDVALEKLSPVITEQVPEWDNETHQYMGYAISRNSVNSASQLLYPASYFGEHENAYQIQSLAFTVVKEEYMVDPVQMKIYLAQVDRTDGYTQGNKESLVPADEFTLVYDGIFATEQSAEPQVIKLDLQRLFTLENGKALVVNIETTAPGVSKYYLDLATVQTEEKYVAYTRTADGGDDAPIENFNIYDNGRLNATNMLPCLTLGYALEPLPAKVDLEATALELTTADVKVDEPATFKVSFTNVGTVDVEAYTIELIDENETVLQSYEGTEYVAVGESMSQKVKYTFTEAGEYKVAARIVVADDVDELNNTTPEVEVTVTVPEVIDLKATALELTTEDVKVDQPAAFKVSFENAGNVAVEAYTIELIDENETVLQSYEGAAAVAAGETASQDVEYTFAAAGEYKVAARIVVEGDADLLNNTTAEVTVTVTPTTGIGYLAVGAFAYDAATSTVFANGEGVLAVYDLAGHAVKSVVVDGNVSVKLDLVEGVYVVTFNGKTLKIRK